MPTQCFGIEAIEQAVKEMRETGFDEFSTTAIITRLEAAQLHVHADSAFKCANCKSLPSNHPNRMCDTFDPPNA